MKGRGGRKTFLIVALLIIITVSLVYLSRQEVREGMKDNSNEKKKRETFRMREALNAGCYSSAGKYLGTGTGIVDCQKKYPGKSATYKSR
jgi:hypothetical protein